MYKKELEIMKKAALKGAEEILDIYYNYDFDVEYKSDNTPLTIADQKSNDVIVDMLKENFPDYAILSEESEDDLRRFEAEYVWVIDPLDGTREFVKKNDEFTVNIALVKGEEVVVGLVYCPVIKEMYYAVKGEGAFFEYEGKVERLYVKENTDKLEIIRTHSAVKKDLLDLFEDPRISVIRKMGGSRKAGYIARGLADVHYSFGITMEWDVAPMDLIITEAGGIFRQLDGTVMKYNREDNMNRKGFYILNTEKNLLL